MQNFSCSALLRCRLDSDSGFRLQAFHLLRGCFPTPSPNRCLCRADGPTTPRDASPHPRFGLMRFRSPLLAQSLLFSLPPGTEMFQFPGFAPLVEWYCRFTAVGCPIRKSARLGIFAPLRGLSQLVTSFFASESQGILHVPFSPFLFLYPERRLFVSIFFVACCTHTFLRRRSAPVQDADCGG